MIYLKLATLTGKFGFQGEPLQVANADEALKIVEAHAASGGFTHVKKVDDGDPCSFRYTARTPGGRSGRNIAFLDYE